MKKNELLNSLQSLSHRQLPELYNVNDFEVWDKLGKQFTGDIWNDGQYIWKIECYSHLIKDLQPSVIFETGFNAGRSACMFLNQSRKYVNKPVKFYSNDIHERSLKNVNLLKEEFNNFEFILGDSKKVLSTYLKENDIKIDFALVDGDHTYQGALSDCRSFQPHINEGGMIFVDDWWISGVARGAMDASWDGWTIFECPKYERGATIFLKDGGSGEFIKHNTVSSTEDLSQLKKYH